MPDAETMLAFFAGCALMALYFGLSELARLRKLRAAHRSTSSLPPLTDGDPFTVFECDSEWYYTDNFGVVKKVNRGTYERYAEPRN